MKCETVKCQSIHSLADSASDFDKRDWLPTIELQISWVWVKSTIYIKGCRCAVDAVCTVAATDGRTWKGCECTVLGIRLLIWMAPSCRLSVTASACSLFQALFDLCAAALSCFDVNIGICTLTKWIYRCWLKHRCPNVHIGHSLIIVVSVILDRSHYS